MKNGSAILHPYDIVLTITSGCQETILETALKPPVLAGFRFLGLFCEENVAQSSLQRWYHTSPKEHKNVALDKQHVASVDKTYNLSCILHILNLFA